MMKRCAIAVLIVGAVAACAVSFRLGKRVGHQEGTVYQRVIHATHIATELAFVRRHSPTDTNAIDHLEASLEHTVHQLSLEIEPDALDVGERWRVQFVKRYRELFPYDTGSAHANWISPDHYDPAVHSEVVTFLGAVPKSHSREFDQRIRGELHQSPRPYPSNAADVLTGNNQE